MTPAELRTLTIEQKREIAQRARVSLASVYNAATLEKRARMWRTTLERIEEAAREVVKKS